MARFTGLPKVPIRGPRPLPLAGPIPNILRFLGDPVGRMLALQREFGDVVAVNDGEAGLICAFGAERNREVITNHAVYQSDDTFFFDPPKGSALERGTKSLVLLNGEQHRRHRRLLAPAFQKASIEGYACDIVAVTEAELRRWPIGQTVDVAALLQRLTSAVALRCLFGIEPGAEADELGAMMTRMMALLASPAAAVFPFQVPGTPFHEVVDVAERFEVRLRAIIAEKRRQPPGQRDALALVLRAHDEDGEAFTDDELIGEMLTLFSAGYDTSAQTLGWTLFLLTQHPEIHAALIDEIDGVLRGGAPSVESVPKLALLDRVIKESMRILPATPTLFLRVCKGEAPLGPYTLPRQANVILSPFMTQRDPDRYPEPRRFRPARWERLEPTLYEYMPFGAGPRMCLGAAFATLALRLILPMILQRYRASLAWGARVSRTMHVIVLGFKHGLPMLIAPQDRHFPRPPRVGGDIHELVELPS